MSATAVQTEADRAIARGPVREMLVVAAPVVATMMSYTVAQFVDGVMVSRLGDGALAAQGNGGVIVFVPLAIMMGVFGVINTYVSQHLGAGTARKAPAFPWNGIWLGVMAWAALIPMAVFMRPAAPGWRATTCVCNTSRQTRFRPVGPGWTTCSM